MTNRLKLYNRALTHVGSRLLSSLTDDVESRYVLDNVWDDDAVNYCLEQGDWNFATRTIKIDYTSEVEPEFGLQRAFVKPSDWVRTTSVCYDEYFQSPVLMYADEIKYWWAKVDELYVKYISNDADYGLSYGDWPPTFAEYVSFYLAFHAAPRLTMSQAKQDDLERQMKRALSNAKTKDAANQPDAIPASGRWVRARARSQFGNNLYHGGWQE